jgi:DNA-binding NarL/FixJ family response regulator
VLVDLEVILSCGIQYNAPASKSLWDKWKLFWEDLPKYGHVSYKYYALFSSPRSAYCHRFEMKRPSRKMQDHTRSVREDLPEKRWKSSRTHATDRFAAPVPTRSDSSNSSPSIAVVDDHASIADSLAYALQGELGEFQVVPISCLENIVAQLIDLAPAVVIVDWQLNNGRAPRDVQSGVQLIQDVAKKLPKTRWILFTAYPRAYVIKEALAAGIMGCVSKSAGYKELVAAVLDVVNGKRHFCSESQEALTDMSTPSADFNTTERDILKLLAQGKEPKEIAKGVGLTVKSVHNCIGALRKKLGVVSMVDLAKCAEERGIVPPRT